MVQCDKVLGGNKEAHLASVKYSPIAFPHTPPGSCYHIISIKTTSASVATASLELDEQERVEDCWSQYGLLP